MTLRAGSTLGHYEIVEPLAAGGMGKVFVARDTHLDRKVAVKVLPDPVAESPEALERFEREAKILAGVSHSNILTIHDFAADDGVHFAVTELLDGETLGDRLERRGALRLEEALDVALAVAKGLAAAHRKQIVHRDIKPSNLFLEADGGVKILDFGLARSEGVAHDPLAQAETLASPTSPGMVLGTLGYMSPEQARGFPAHAASDVFSFGCVLYEMLTGEAPFKRRTHSDMLAAILHDEPPRPAELPVELDRVLRRCLAKDEEGRYASAVELLADLERVAEGMAPRTAPSIGAWLRRPPVAIAVTLALAVALFLGGRSFRERSKVTWAREIALPEIGRLVDEGRFVEAYSLVQESQPYIAGDAAFQEARDDTSSNVAFHTEPPGAEVFYQRYDAPGATWAFLGTTPMEEVRVPFGPLRWRIEKEGYETRLVATAASRAYWRAYLPDPEEFERGDPSRQHSYVLDAEGTAPAGMVAVEGGRYRSVPLARGGVLNQVSFAPFRIDRTEVTNREFEEFVEAGGYEDERYWQEPLVQDGRVLSWRQGMARFRDSTGRPGPAGWVLGHPPKGEAELPVGGVSWYEAAAYARFRGKNLPTIFHWIRAALASSESGAPLAHAVVALSRFDPAGPRAVASQPNLGRSGTYDQAGNVREWTSTALGERRYSLGGGWDDPTYFFNEPYPQSPWDRSLHNGLRCVLYSEPPAPEVLRAFAPPVQDFYGAEPLSDDAFATLSRLYAYDRRPLNPMVEEREEKPWGDQEWVTVDAAYGAERLPIRLHLPRGAEPPYQPVVYFPGMLNLVLPALRGTELSHRLHFLVEEGRALVEPVYEWTFERNREGQGIRRLYAPNDSRELLRHWYQDLARTIDYLEGRDDIDTERIAFLGMSLGSTISHFLLAFEERIDVSVLLAGGFSSEIDQADADLHVGLAQRVEIPTLMLGTAYDHLFPPETHQKPYRDLLGTPEEHKRLVIYEMGGHAAIPQAELIRESLAWLDTYLGR